MRYLSSIFLLVFFIADVSLAQTATSGDDGNEIRIGVLAFRGFQITRERWQPMADYLSEQIVGHHFTIIPVNNDNIESLVEQGKIDFVLSNPASYAILEKQFQVRRLATMLNKANGGTSTEFGAVIFTRKDRLDIQDLEDLKGKRFMAVHRNAFGGWWMAKREIKRSGLDPNKDFLQLKFSSFPQDKIVYAVLNNEVDAGTVRTSLLERMNRDGLIDIRQFKILNPQHYHYFSQQLSTRLYPEWPFAATKKVPVKLAQDVALALLRMPEDHRATRSALIGGWTAPLDYQSVDDLMKELHVGYYENYGEISMAEIVAHYWHWLVYVLFAVFFLAVLSSYVIGRNRRLLFSNRQLEREILVREELQGRLRYQALHDTLTELPNRSLLLDRMHQAINTSARNEERLAVAIIDLDQFKRINDTLGHEMGDKVLKQVSERFLEVVRKSDTLARLGGDEFVLLMQGFGRSENTVAIVQKLVDVLHEPVSVTGHHCKLGVSIGISLFPDHGKSSEELLRHADLAMYKAKYTGISILMYDHAININKDSR
jgi:diguanylate cyclase (GGDEF)-like protein